MPEPLQPKLSRRERQIMDILYRLQSATVAEVLAELPDQPSYSTVRAQLRVLEQKGHVRHEEQGLRYVFAPIVPRDRVQQSALRHLVETFFEGSAEKVVAALLGGTSRPSDEELNRLSQLIDQAKKRGTEMNVIAGTAENQLGLLLVSTLKASLLLAVAWMLNRLLGRYSAKSAGQAGSAAVRHFIWATAVAGAVVLPLLSYLAPGWRFKALTDAAPQWLVAPSQSAIEQVASLPAFMISADPNRPWQEHVAQALWWMWAGGVLALAWGLLLGSARLAWLAWRSKRIVEPSWTGIVDEMAAAFGIRRRIVLLQSREPVMPVTWGARRPRVLLPPDCLTWSHDRIRVVLAHEMAHIARHDWAVQMIAEIGRAIYWFNPLIWISCNRLRTESELAADDAVINLGIRPSGYAEQLLEIARSLKRPAQAWLPALAVARQSNLERRLIAMLNPSLDRRAVTAKSAFLVIAAALCLLLPLAALETLSGKFYGTVYDPSGGVIPNATVIASSADGKTRDMTSSSAAGVFEFIDLPAGAYNVEVLSPGFMRYVMSQVKLEANKNQHVTVNLIVGKITERITVGAQGTPKSAKESPAATPQRIRVGGNVQATKLVNIVKPSYPTVAKAAGIQGTVILEAVIAKEGNLVSLRVMNTQIDPDLARAAVEAVSQWKYQPTLLNGEPVEVIVQIDVNFTLQP